MALLQITEPGQSQQNQDASEFIIGIDLGTTNSLVGVVIDEKVEILADENGCDITPSVVSYDAAGNVISVGKSLKEGATISSIKRLMGKDKNFRVTAGSRQIRPEEVSAEILKHLKTIAQTTLRQAQGDEVIIKKAVITVPAYFDEAAKNATKLAANLADLEVVRLVNEPTAAALAYGLENSSEGIYCVYDLGGGTFDVSILKMQKGVFKVLGVAGDNHLGGDDFDDLVAQELGVSHAQARKIKEELSWHERVGAVANHAQQKPEAVMLSLSKHDSSPEPETCFDRLSMTPSDFGITRKEFENLIAEKIEKTVTLTKNLLDDLDLQSHDVKGLILVGGSTRIPLVQKKLAEIFGEEKILTNLDPDRVVAIGAAWQAHNLSSGGKKNLLLDVNPLSLGIEMMGGIVEKIIPRNSSIPTAYAKEFTTYAANQTGMKFHILQGERELAKDCRSLANFEIKGIPPMPAGMARIGVVFKLDADGLLTVSAQEKITKVCAEIEVKPSFSLDEFEVKKMLLDSLKNSQSDMENRLLIQAATDAMQDVAIIESDLKNPALFEDENEKKLIAEKLKILQEAIEEKTSRDAILAAQDDLAKAAENLVLRKVNDVLMEKIAGKKIDEISQKK
jgi:molecular chaperone HscA